MKLKLEKIKEGKWQAGVYRGRGGVSSLIASRVGGSLWYAIGVFTPRNLWRGLFWQ